MFQGEMELKRLKKRGNDLEGIMARLKRELDDILYNLDGDNISKNAIKANHIQAGTITGKKIAAKTIEGDNIAAGTIDASNVKAMSLVVGKDVKMGEGIIT